MSDFRDREGNALTLLEWAGKFEDGRYGRVEVTLVEDVCVSTAWNGIVMPGASIPPEIYATYVFGGEHDGLQRRYSSEAAAVEGHAAVVEMIRQAKEAS